MISKYYNNHKNINNDNNTTIKITTIIIIILTNNGMPYHATKEENDLELMIIDGVIMMIL